MQEPHTMPSHQTFPTQDMTNNTTFRRYAHRDSYVSRICPSTTGAAWRHFISHFRKLCPKLPVIYTNVEKVEETIYNPRRMRGIETEIDNLSWAEILTFLEWEDFSQFIAARPDGSAYVHLRYGCCDKVGMKCAITWMTKVYEIGRQSILPPGVEETTMHILLHYCSIERALLLLGLRESETIHSIIRDYLNTEAKIFQLGHAWENLPQEIVWASMIVHHVGQRLGDANNNIFRRGHCMRGWKHVSRQKDHTCTPTWVYEDDLLRNKLGCTF
ncbi:hypothetical protein PTMSG1_07326 [Pyrenophora teres f. maculata]|nr:hypothetical protein PTMSG1_07326 [Pyrenophora teres f. maculata]